MDEAAAAASLQAMTIGDVRCGDSASAVASGNVESTDMQEAAGDHIPVMGAGEAAQPEEKSRRAALGEVTNGADSRKHPLPLPAPEWWWRRSG